MPVCACVVNALSQECQTRDAVPVRRTKAKTACDKYLTLAYFSHTFPFHLAYPPSQDSPRPLAGLMHVLSCPRGICVRLNVFDKVSLLTRRRSPSPRTHTHAHTQTHTFRSLDWFMSLCEGLHPGAWVCLCMCVRLAYLYMRVKTSADKNAFG